ncbi:hypothetical protein PWT90_02969 [Aphanocladium album]|nr:hypothetical protein PWT90_02969 [Aphanocladium album]
MAPEIPATTRQWTVSSSDGSEGFDALKFNEVQLASTGDNEVLVKMEAASLNGKYPFAVQNNIVPGSDGAGIVLAVGSRVARFKPGNKVITLFNQEHLGGPINPSASATGLGGARDGTFREFGNFNEQGLVHRPSTLSAIEAAALPHLTAGQWVLTQGTDGVSIFALQFAKAAGAPVIATTGSKEKEETLRKLGADHAREITGGVGVGHVIEVASPTSMRQSINAIKVAGFITIIGFVGGGEHEKEHSFLECLNSLFTARGVLVGNRVQLEDMRRAYEANSEQLRPVIDSQVFGLENPKEAYEHWKTFRQGLHQD